MKKNITRILLSSIIFTSVFGGQYIFPQKTEAAGWYDTNYTYCRKLTMTAGGDSGGVATTTTLGFALVATSTISSLAATTTGGGRIQKITEWNNAASTTPIDVAVTNGTDCNSDGGSLIDFYFEKYATSTGAFTLWVEPTDISSTTAKTVLLYYGNASASSLSNKTGVWGGLSETGVFNSNEDPSITAPQVRDATSNGFNGTSAGSMTTSDQISGQVDGAIEYDGVNDYVSMGDVMDFERTTSFTLSAWYRLDVVSPSLQYFMFGKNRSSGSFDGYSIRVRGAEANDPLQFSLAGADSSLIRVRFPRPDDSLFHHVLVTYNGSSAASGVTAFVDGVSQTITIVDDTLVDTTLTNVNFVLGAFEGSSLFFPGAIDDVRVFSRKLHAMDVKTIYNNTASSAIFWTFGGEETQSGAVGPVPSRTLRLFGSFTIKFVSGRIILRQK